MGGAIADFGRYRRPTFRRIFRAFYEAAKDYGASRAAAKRKPISVIGSVAPGSTVTIARLAKVSRAKYVSRVEGRGRVTFSRTKMNINHPQITKYVQEVDTELMNVAISSCLAVMLSSSN